MDFLLEAFVGCAEVSSGLLPDRTVNLSESRLSLQYSCPLL